MHQSAVAEIEDWQPLRSTFHCHFSQVAVSCAERRTMLQTSLSGGSSLMIKRAKQCNIAMSQGHQPQALAIVKQAS